MCVIRIYTFGNRKTRAGSALENYNSPAFTFPAELSRKLWKSSTWICGGWNTCNRWFIRNRGLRIIRGHWTDENIFDPITNNCRLELWPATLNLTKHISANSYIMIWTLKATNRTYLFGLHWIGKIIFVSNLIRIFVIIQYSRFSYIFIYDNKISTHQKLNNHIIIRLQQLDYRRGDEGGGQTR